MAGKDGAQPKKKKKHRVRRAVLFVLLLAVLGIAGWIGVTGLRAEYRVTYDGYTASRGSISNSLTYTGSMQLVHNKTFNASSAGKVREVYVAVGDRVSEGDRLVRLSTGETLTAEFDGTVNKVEVKKGDEVNGGAALVQVADFDNMRVSFRVGEGDISDVSVGQRCRVTVPSISATFEAAVTTIDYASYSGNNVAYYTATVDVDTSAVTNIYPGMQATVVLPQEEANDVVVLKMDAVSTARDNSAFVYKEQEDGTMLAVPVTVGVSNGSYVEIREGVAEGETVYAVAKKEDAQSMWAALMNAGFGSQQVNRPGRNNGNFGGGNNSFGGGGNNGGGNWNRGTGRDN